MTGPNEEFPPLANDTDQEAVVFRNELLYRSWPDGRRVAEIAHLATSLSLDSQARGC